ncbi:MAG: hypothetical protein JXQ93_11520, partial [Flavobacteriaceae bacterium]
MKKITFLLSFLTLLIAQFTNAQTTYTFDAGVSTTLAAYGTHPKTGPDIASGEFNDLISPFIFSITGSGSGSISRFGGEVTIASVGISSANYQMSVTRKDASNFDLQSFTVENSNGYAAATIVVTGKNNGVAVSGASFSTTMPANGATKLIDLSSDNDFNNIDEFTVTFTGTVGTAWSFHDITINKEALLVGECNVENAYDAANTNNNNLHLGQSFVACQTGTLKSIALLVTYGETSSGETINVYSGSTVSPGNLLGSVTGQTFNDNGGTATNLNVTDFSAQGIAITTGQTYTFDVPTTANLVYTNDNGYANGGLYLNGVDNAGNFDLIFDIVIESAADTTPPVFENSTPSQSSVTQTGFTLGTDIDEAGTIYYVVVADGAGAPSAAQVKAGQDSSGGSPVTSGNAAVSTGGFTNDFSVTSLTAGTAYDVYVVAEDDEGSPNLQASATKIDVTTSPPTSASINDPSVAEGASGSTTLQFTVSLTAAAPAGGATVNFATSNGTATAGADYTATSGTVSFSAGETSKTIDVTVAGDATVENDETLTITLSNPTGTDVVIGDTTGTGTITNDDTATVTIANVAVNENDGTATVTLVLDNAVDGGFDVDVSTADNTATTADGDYTAVTSATETFAGTASETQTFDITIGGDTKVEINELIDIFMNNLVVPTVSSSDISITDTASVTITNDDQATVTIANVSGNEDDGSITVTVTVDNAVDGGFDVNVSTADNTATTADSDYTPVSAQTLSFSGTAGESETFTITPTADATSESDETVIIGMVGLFPGTVSSSDIDITDGAILTILNDDDVSVSINDPSVSEGASGSTTLQFTVSLSDPAPAGGATVDYATSNGTATAGTDYTAIGTTTLSFSAGETSKTIDVTVAGDATVENDETLTITLSNPTGTSVIISDATGTGTITNDDTATVTIANVAVNENDGTATVTLALDNAVDGGFDVDVSTADNTATTADGDYTAVTSATETFAGTASETQTFDITIGGDTKVEINELIDIFMNNLVVPTVSSSNISITDTASVTITNDDQAIVTIANVSGNEDDGAITVTVTLDNAVDGGFDVNVSTADNTATTADSDYTPVSAQTLSFSGTAGESETFTITPTADVTSESDETVIIGMVGLFPGTVSSSDIDITDGAILTILNDDDVSVSINDPSVSEGASGSTTLQFTVSLSGPAPAGGATVDYATSNGTATAGTDYTAIGTTTLSFSAGETSKTIDVTVEGDATVENDETLTITLSNPTGTSVIISDATGTGTITNDDTATVTIANVVVNENAGTATVTLALDNAVDGGFDVDVSTADNTATTADSDYTAVVSATETFAGTASETQTFDITIGGDTKVEINELIDIFMNNLVVPTVSSSDISITDTASVTITNDDQATVTIANVSGNEDDGSITVTVTLDNAVDGGFDVNVSTADNTATTADSDYTPVSAQTLSFSGTAGESETFTITPTADVTSESDETVIIGMVGLFPGTVSSSDIDITDGAILTILNDDDISASINDPSVAEGASGSTILQYTVTLSGAAPAGGATIDFATSDGTAEAGSDYTTTSGTVSFSAGETSKTIDVTVSGDMMVEVDETLTMTLSNPTGTSVIISDATGIGTITNDDTTVVTIADVSANENAGTQSIVATLSNPVQGGFTLNVFTTDGTGTTADSDYSSTGGSTLTFTGNAGETQTLNLGGLGDTKVEADETFTISMTNIGFTSVNPANIDITDVATYTILNDDTATVTINNVSVNEDSGIATVTLTLDNLVDGGFSVDVSTQDGTATIADPDYAGLTSATENFTGTAGETQTLDITIGIDSKVEADEVLSLLMNNVVAVTVDVSDIDVSDTATVTITNDDSATVTIADVSVNEADGTATFTATLSNEVVGGFTVDVSTADGTAMTSDSDYTPVTSQTLNFTGNASETQTFMVNITDDNIVETDETVSISMSNVVSGTASTSAITITDTATLTITNDDTTVVTIADVSANENAGTQSIVATLSNPVQGGFTLNVFTTDGTGTTADSDYSSTGGSTLTFTGNAGETQTLNLGGLGDTKVEADETFTISMTNIGFTSVNPSNIDITDVATYTILNDDSAAITIEDISGNEDDGALTLTATLDNPVDGGFTVNIDFTDGTATIADSDYTTASPVVLNFAGNIGETQTFTVTPTADTKVEADETLFIGLSNLIAPIVENLDVSTSDGATVMILNDDSASLAIDNVSMNEGSGGATTNFTFTVTLTGEVDVPFTVDYNTNNITAIAGIDYTTANGTLNFAGTNGEAQTFMVSIAGDDTVELDESFAAILSNLQAVGRSITLPSQGVGTIQNDDTTTVTIADVSGNEDDGTITVSVTSSHEVDGGFSIDVSTTDGTATTADSDYTATTETLFFTGAPGQTITYTITPTTDNKVEADETLTVVLSNLSSTTLTTAEIIITDTATITINNDDNTVVTIEDITMTEAEGVANLTATLTNPVQDGFVLNITTTDGTAVTTSDYTSFADAAGATFVGTAGETQTVAIPITDDMIGEEIETFTVTLTSVSGTGSGANITTTDTATVTIIDDDAPVVTMVSVPTDGNYGIGSHLDFTVTFTNAATTTGNPSIPITIGSSTVQAVLNGAITNSLTADFRYTIVEGDLDVDGISVGSDILLNGGTIVGSTNIDAILTLNNVGNTSNVNVDGIKPIPTITSGVPDPTNAAFDITITFDEPVTGFTIDDIDVGNGVAGNFNIVSTTVYTA